MEIEEFTDPYEGTEKANRVFTRPNHLSNLPQAGSLITEVYTFSRFTEPSKDQVWNFIKEGAIETTKILDLVLSGQPQVVVEQPHPTMMLISRLGKNSLKAITEDSENYKRPVFESLDEILAEGKQMVVCHYGFLPSKVIPEEAPVDSQWYGNALQADLFYTVGLGNQVQISTCVDEGIAKYEDFNFEPDEKTVNRIISRGPDELTESVLKQFLHNLETYGYEELEDLQEPRVHALTIKSIIQTLFPISRLDNSLLDVDESITH